MIGDNLRTIIEKRDGGYRARVPLRDGTRNYRTKGGFRLRGDAVQWAETIEREIAKGQTPEPSRGQRYTLGDALDAHLVTWQGAWSPRTSRRKRTVFGSHVSGRLRATALVGLRHTHFVAWVGELAIAGYSPRTIRHSLDHVAKALNDEIPYRIGVNYARLDVVKQAIGAPQTSDEPALAPEQIGMLHDAFDDRWSVGVSLCYVAGLRRSEMLGLTWDRIDFLRRRITVDRQWIGGASSGGFTGPKGSKPNAPKARVVPVPESLLIELNEHKRRHGLGEHGLVLHGRVFNGRGAGPLSDGAWGAAFLAAASAAGLDPTVTTHTLRHACGSRWAAEYPGHDKRSARWMGHTLAVFHRVYVHETESDDRIVMADPFTKSRTDRAPEAGSGSR